MSKSPRNRTMSAAHAASYGADTVGDESRQKPDPAVPMMTISEHEYAWLKSCEKAVRDAQAKQYTKAQEANKPLLQRANELIGGDRQRDYGNKLQNFSQIAMLWQGTLATKLQPDAAITPEDVALCMIQVKIARLAKSPDHEDSLLDVAGYAGCMSLLQKERIEGKELLGATRDPREVPF